ncbi:MAG: hypothetical protein JRJ03_03525 [Deltaproteobacteria bacterium]|nr:hypothetical protein [Deltaproteobacteria bacterium]
MEFANLHLHTLFSDGATSPGDLAEEVFGEPGLKYFALTDHDTMSGIEPLFRAIKNERPGEKIFIPGVELSLREEDLGLNIHLIGLYPGVNRENYREALARIDRVLGEFCRTRSINRGLRDLDARVKLAHDLNLDGIADKFARAEDAIGFLRQKAETRNRKIFRETGKSGDIIEHPIPLTYQLIVDHWKELFPSGSREKTILYILRPDSQKAETLAGIYVSEGLGGSEARRLALERQGILCNIKRPAIQEKGSLDGLEMLKRSGAVSILAHPAIDHRRIDFEEFDSRILYPLLDHGLDGIEVFYPYDTSYRPEAIERYEGIARKRGLLISGGTDFHGDGRVGLREIKLDVREAQRIMELGRHLSS